MKKISISIALICLTGIVFGQGSLTPPSAPAPTMKTLDQVEARTPLVAGSPGVSVAASGTISITNSGSYYLTENLTVTPTPCDPFICPAGNGITINASGVTLDLNGFTIRSTQGVAAGTAIEINDSNVSVFNGHIVSGTSYNSGGSGDQFTGSGFDYGIHTPTESYNDICIRDITISGVDLDGISVGNGSSIVESCVVNVAGSYGIKAGNVRNCRAESCGGIAISAITVEGGTGKSVGWYGIYASVVANSYGYSTSTGTDHDGIYATYTVQNSYGFSKSRCGIICFGTIGNSRGHTSSTGTDANGVYAGEAVQNSYGDSSGGNGLTGKTVANCIGNTTSTSVDADGIHAFYTVQNSYGYSLGRHGIYCYGTVDNCYGYTHSTHTDADGIYAVRTVQNSYGESRGDDGIECTGVASYSWGKSTGTEPDAYGIKASIAVGCIAVGGTNIVNKYLMP